MAGLTSLIRLKKFAMDDQRRKITMLQNQLDILQREQRRILDDLEAEKKHAAQDEETRAAFPGYNKRMQVRLMQMATEEKNVEAGIVRAQAELQEAFKELKTLEITERERAKRKAAEEKKKEDQTMDDIGLEGFRRKQEDN